MSNLASDLGVPATQNIYTGVWTNWDRSKILGSTWTVSQRDGNFLVAFIALFVSYAGTSLFRVTCFALHNYMSSKSSQDIIYHQRQVVLRNTASGTSALYSFAQLLFYWGRKGKGHRSIRRILPFVLHAAILTSIFAVAGVYSSRIAALEGEVLISNPYLDQPNKTSATTDEYVNIIEPYRSSRINAFSNYAQTCYAGDSRKPSCQSFVQSQIPRTIERNATCPFEDGMCLSNNTNIKLDTGLMDSHTIFGLNAPASKRMLFRYVLQCAPIETKGYSESFNYSDGDLALTYQKFNYGPMIKKNVVTTNYTNMFPDYPRKRIRFENSTGEFPHYGITTEYSNSYNGSWMPLSDNRWKPISSLFRGDADTSIVFLVPKNIMYVGLIDDPWYSAHRQVGEYTRNSNGGSAAAPVYQSDEAASPLGCTEQYQVCIPGSPSNICSPLSAVFDLENFQPPLINEAQYNMTLWFSIKATLFRLQDILGTLGGEALTSKYSLSGMTQAALPDNQWQSDVIRWFDIVSSAMQSATVDFATGPADKRLAQWESYAGPMNEQEQYFARNQKIQSTAYANFSVCALCITLIIGGLIVLLELFMETLYERWLWRFHRSHPYPQMEWCTNGTLQLQRLAHEQIGVGPWEACDKEIPITRQETRLATLNLEDLKSPRLKRSAQSDLTAYDIESGLNVNDSGKRDMEIDNDTFDEKGGDPRNPIPGLKRSMTYASTVVEDSEYTVSSGSSSVKKDMHEHDGGAKDIEKVRDN